MRILWICLLLAGLGHRVSAQHALDSCVRIGLTSNDALKVQVFQVEKSLSALREARGLYLPAVTVNGTYTLAGGGRGISFPIGDLLNPVYATLNQLTQSEQFPQLENFTEQFNPNNFYDVKARTTMPLVNTEIWINRQVKEKMISYQEAQLLVYKRELVRDIKVAYFRWLQAGEAVLIYEEALSLVAENLRVNQKLADNGMVLSSLVIRSEGDLVRLQAQRIEAVSRQQQAAAYLNFLMNRPLDTPIPVDTMPGTYPEVLETPAGISRREELAQLSTAYDMQALALQMNQQYLIPKVNFFWDLGSQGFNFEVSKESFYYLGGLSVEWNVFSGMRNKEKIEQAQLELASLSARQDQVADQLQLQLTTQFQGLEALRAAYSSAGQQVSTTRRYLDDARKQYRENAIPFISLLEAQTLYIQARQQQSVSLYDIYIQIAEIERTQAAYSFSE